MRKVFWFAVLAGGFGVLGSATAEENKALAKLEGSYTIVSGEEGGEAVPAQHLKGSIVRFTANEVVSTDGNKKEVFAATYKLDTTKKPWVISMKSTKPKEGDATGLIKKDGDTVTVIYALPGAPNPTEFKTKEKGQNMFVLKSLGGDKK